MTPEQEHNNTISTALGTVGTVFWCIQLVPQIYTNARRKSTEGLSAVMFLLWAAAGTFSGIYFIVQQTSVALMVQPEIFAFLAFVIVAQCLYYGKQYSLAKTLLLVTAFSAISAGLQTAAIFPIRNSSPYKNNPSPTCWPVLMIGILSALCIILGLLPPYFELARRGGRVVGINFLFLAIDSTGAIFSFASLLFPQTNSAGVQLQKDILGMVQYLIVPLMEGGLILSQLIWWVRIGRCSRKISKQDLEKSMDVRLHETPVQVPRFARAFSSPT